jgi:hypothetical protein
VSLEESEDNAVCIQDVSSFVRESLARSWPGGKCFGRGKRIVWLSLLSSIVNYSGKVRGKERLGEGFQMSTSALLPDPPVTSRRSRDSNLRLSCPVA